jgi:hypothetical protein
MKLIGWLMIVLGVAAVIPGGITLYRDLEQARAIDEKIAEFDKERATSLEQLQQARLEYRGYQNSLPDIPDSVREENLAVINKRQVTMRQKVIRLNSHSEDLKRRMIREERKKTELLADTPMVAGGLGGGGLVLIVAGMVIARRSAGRDRKPVSG